MVGDDSGPIAVIRKRARARPPSSKVTSHSLSASSPVGGLHARVEGDVAAQVELVGQEFAVAQVLGLAGEMLLPVPFLQHLGREGEAVGPAFRIEACAGIAVPVPGAADAAARLVDARLEAHLAQLQELVHARQAGADDDGVPVLGHILDLMRACRFSRDAHGVPHLTLADSIARPAALRRCAERDRRPLTRMLRRTVHVGQPRDQEGDVHDAQHLLDHDQRSGQGVAGVISPKPVEVSTVKEKYIRSDQLSLPSGPCAIVALKACGSKTCRKPKRLAKDRAIRM